MKTNSKNKGAKQRLNFSTIVREEASMSFFTRFFKKINQELTKAFGTKEATRISKLLTKGTLKIVSPETFLFSTKDIHDPSIEIYNDCKNFDEFFYKSLLAFKRKAEEGETEVLIREFFFAWIDALSTKALPISNLKTYMKNFLFLLCNSSHTSPFSLQLLEVRWAREVMNKLGLNPSECSTFMKTFYYSYQELSKEALTFDNFLPRIQIFFPVYPESRCHQLWYLASAFSIPYEHVSSIFREVSDLSQSSPELLFAIETAMNEKGYKYYNPETIITELQRISDKKQLKIYSTMKDFSTNIHNCGVPRSFFSDPRVERICTYKDSYEKTLKNYFSEICINCNHLSKHGIEKHIEAAKNLALVKVYAGKNNFNSKKYERPLSFKITLEQVKEFSQEFVQFIKEKEKSLCSRTNKDFFIQINYSPSAYNFRNMKKETTHIRVISDIHADYNREYQYIFNFGDDFVINCGDTGGNASVCTEWNKSNIRQGVTVAGNHFGYSSCYPELNGIENIETYGNVIHPNNTKNSQIKIMSTTLTNEENGVRLLSNSMTTYKGIVILGTTLYTDFALYGKKSIEESMHYAKQYMNDFRTIMVVGHREYSLNPDGTWKITMKKREVSKVRPFTPQDHAYFFHYSLNFLKEKVIEYSDKPIIIVTHHAPSPYSIDEQYAGSPLNPAFASNLDKFILSNPQIRLWCHGHMHNPCDYILGETRVVCTPFGYNNENNYDLPYNYGTRIAIADIKSKKSWKKICQKEIEEGSIFYYRE